MATLPRSNVSISAEASALAGGTGFAVVIGCAGTGVDDTGDVTPIVFSSASAMYATYGYSQALDYVALHIKDTQKPVIFVGLPKATAGTAGSHDSSGVTGTCNITVSAGANGYLEEVNAILTVDTGGTIGTAGIIATLSMDGGRTEKTIRLGTATSYTVPYLGIIINFQSGGTLVAGDVYTFRTAAPMWDSAGMAAAKDALAAQLKPARSFVVAEELANATFAGYVTTAVNDYETEDSRFVYGRVNVKDRSPLAKKSKVKKRMSGSPTLTFAEVGATGDTIARSAGSFITDGFVVGDLVTVTGAVNGANNVVDAVIASLSATVITLDTTDLVDEAATADCTLVGSESLTFAEVGATGDTITRSTGSWLADGFAVGDKVTVAGTALNEFTEATVTNVTATVLTLDTQDLAAETIAGWRVSVDQVLTMSAWVSAMDSAFASVDGQKRIDIAIGRLRKISPFTNWEFRRPVSWAASIREYQKDVHITTWRKEDGPLLDWDMLDDDGNVVEYDERTVGGALAARFTCARTWANGPNGAFIARSLTRDTEGSVLGETHNMAVANVFCTVVQTATENFVGKTPQVDEDGHILPASLGVLEESINTDLQIALMQEKVPGAGPRASRAVWTGSSDDDLTAPDAAITGTGDLRVNGTIVDVNTSVKVS